MKLTRDDPARRASAAGLAAGAAALALWCAVAAADATPAAVPPPAVELVSQARVALAASRSEDAVALLERARDLAPRSASVQLALVEGYAARVDQVSMLGKVPYAKKIRAALEAAVAAEPRNPHALFGLLQFHVQAPAIAGGSSAEADRIVRELASLDPAWGHRAAAFRASRDGQPDVAARELRAAVALRPGEAAFGIDLVLNAQARNDWEEAHTAASKLAAAGSRPGLYQVGRTGALSGRRLGEAESALRTYLEAPAAPGDPLRGPREPPSDAAWYRLGQVLAFTPARRAEAHEALKKALALNPANDGAKKALAGLR
jgi:tetratricopeptide (TPR) repeat protein